MKSKYSFSVKYLIYFILFILVGYCAFYIVYNANWVNGDDQEWIRSTAIGIIEPMSVHVGNGRFWPLGHYDSNLTLLLPYGYTAVAHYLLVAIWFCFMSYFFVCTIRKYIKNINAFLLLSSYSFLVYSCYSVYLSIIYSEKIVLMGLSMVMYLLYRLHKNECLLTLFTLIFVTTYITYAKEPIFCLFLIYAIFMHIFYKNTVNKFVRYYCYYCIFNAVVYVVLYYFIVYCNSNSFYNEGRVCVGYVENVLLSIQQQPFIIVAFSLLLYRLIVYLKNRIINNTDVYLLMSCAYVCAFFILKLNAAYYFIPAVLLALPSLCVELNNLIEKKYINYAVYVLLTFITLKSVKNIYVMAEATQYNRKYYPEYFRNLASIAQKYDIYVVTDSTKMSDLFYRYRVNNDEIFIGYWMSPRNLNYKFKYVESLSDIPYNSYVRTYDGGIKFLKIK